MITPNHLFMQRAIALAQQGIGNVSPNPLVGAVIVSPYGEILGEGFHEHYGKAHAEVNAINDVFKRHHNADELLAQSSIYVTLEPCSHFGKTPPCSSLLVEKKIKNVYIGNIDPNPKVKGQGIEKLKSAGIQVLVGIEHDACTFLNRRFFTTQEKQRPYIILNWAETLDGYIAPIPLAKRQISGSMMNGMVHQWRAEEDAILVGKNTAMLDNPQLNVRLVEGRNPVRIVIDKNLELPSSLHLFNQQQKTVVFNALKQETMGLVHYIQLENFEHYLPQQILYQLFLMDIQSIIIEGGRKTLDLFIEQNLWDETRIERSLCVQFGTGLKAPHVTKKCVETIPLEQDCIDVYYNL